VLVLTTYLFKLTNILGTMMLRWRWWWSPSRAHLPLDICTHRAGRQALCHRIGGKGIRPRRCGSAAGAESRSPSSSCGDRDDWPAARRRAAARLPE
jgi:hypothetical protein